MADVNPARGITRRNILSIGSLGFLGLNLVELYRAEAAEVGSAGNSAATSPIKSCILLYQSGGPSHLDTWDMKPDAPLEVRGNFKSISSRVPGLHVCEHLPISIRLDAYSRNEGYFLAFDLGEKFANSLVLGRIQ